MVYGNVFWWMNSNVIFASVLDSFDKNVYISVAESTAFVPSPLDWAFRKNIRKILSDKTFSLFRPSHWV